MSSFKNRMAEVMKMKNIRQTEVSAATGIPKSTLSRYMKGSYEPKQENLYALAEFFGVTPSWLLGYTDDPTDKDYRKIPKEEPAEKKTSVKSVLELLFSKTNIYNRIKPEQALNIPKDYIECYPNDTQLAFGKWYTCSLRKDGVFVLMTYEKGNIRDFLQYMAVYKQTTVEEIATAAGLKEDFLTRLATINEEDIYFSEIKAIAKYFGLTTNCVIGDVLNPYIIEAVADKIGDDKELNVQLENFKTIAERHYSIIGFEYVKEIAEKMNCEITDLVYFNQFEQMNSTRESDEGEKELIRKFRSLNDDGQRRLTDYLDDLISGKRYMR